MEKSFTQLFQEGMERTGHSIDSLYEVLFPRVTVDMSQLNRIATGEGDGDPEILAVCDKIFQYEAGTLLQAYACEEETEIFDINDPRLAESGEYNISDFTEDDY
jgi:hypothetical protein